MAVYITREEAPKPHPKRAIIFCLCSCSDRFKPLPTVTYERHAQNAGKKTNYFQPPCAKTNNPLLKLYTELFDKVPEKRLKIFTNNDQKNQPPPKALYDDFCQKAGKQLKYFQNAV